jgi:hypothetical protein
MSCAVTMFFMSSFLLSYQDPQSMLLVEARPLLAGVDEPQLGCTLFSSFLLGLSLPKSPGAPAVRQPGYLLLYEKRGP